MILNLEAQLFYRTDTKEFLKDSELTLPLPEFLPHKFSFVFKGILALHQHAINSIWRCNGDRSLFCLLNQQACHRMSYNSTTILSLLSFFAHNFFPNRFVQVLGHGALASFLCFRARSVNLTNKASITSFYMFIWKASEFLLDLGINNKCFKYLLNLQS